MTTEFDSKRVKINSDDILANCIFVISSKLKNPQFAGQTKERLDSKDHMSFVSSSTKDSLSIWLNQHTEEGEKIADLAIAAAQKRIKSSTKVDRKKTFKGPLFLESFQTVTAIILKKASYF